MMKSNQNWIEQKGSIKTLTSLPSIRQSKIGVQPSLAASIRSEIMLRNDLQVNLPTSSMPKLRALANVKGPSNVGLSMRRWIFMSVSFLTCKQTTASSIDAG